MKKALVLLIFIVFIAWLNRVYFGVALTKEESTKNYHEKKDKSIKKLPIHNADVTIDKKEIKILEAKEVKIATLTQLLSENRFYDAMAFYLENTKKNYLKEIENYLVNLAKTNPSLGLEYMHAFLDAVPESIVLKFIISTYVAEESYAKAIEFIIQAKENYVSQGEDTRLKTQLKDVAISYIDSLMKVHDYVTLIAFLEDMITYDGDNSFYSYRLAQIYMKLDKIDEASLLLDTLQYDEVYAQNVKSMLKVIDKAEEEDEYKYAIPLQRNGEHYTVYVFLDGVEFNLMLDTGATYIFLDEDKASVLSLLGEDIRLQTAANDILAKRASIGHLKVGNVEMSNVIVTIAPFKREGIDGLLGMNFFKQFTFFISQEESMLYLNPKGEL